MTFGILRFANFAHGETMTLGVYIAWTLVLADRSSSPMMAILLVLMPISMLLTIMVVLLHRQGVLQTVAQRHR